MQTPTLDVQITYVLLFIPFFLVKTDHGMVADGSVGSASSAIGFPSA